MWPLHQSRDLSRQWPASSRSVSNFLIRVNQVALGETQICLLLTTITTLLRYQVVANLEYMKFSKILSAPLKNPPKKCSKGSFNSCPDSEFYFVEIFSKVDLRWGFLKFWLNLKALGFEVNLLIFSFGPKSGTASCKKDEQQYHKRVLVRSIWSLLKL